MDMEKSVRAACKKKAYRRHRGRVQGQGQKETRLRTRSESRFNIDRKPALSGRLVRLLAEDRNDIIDDLHEAAADVELLFRTAGLHTDVACAEQHEHRSVAAHHTDFAVP